MKILMLGWELPPHNSGGMGVACYHLSRHLALRGLDLEFVVPYKARHKQIDFMKITSALPYGVEELREHGGGIYDSWEYTKKISKTKHTAGMPRGLREQQAHYTAAVERIVKTGDYDVIHAHDWLTYEAAMAAKKISRAPVIAHVHATEFDRSGDNHGNPLVHEIEYNGLLAADRVIAVSKLTKDIIVREYAIPADKIDVVHNSIEPSEFTPIQEATTYAYLNYMKTQGYTVVVSTNRLTIQKGLPHLLRAAKLAISKQPKLLFLLCGSGEQYHELLELSAELGIARNVLFSGFVRGQALRDAYEVADIFVMPSVSEPFGLAAMEAVGYGKVTMVSKQSGVCEAIDNILKFDYWDARTFADYLVSAAQHPGMRQTLQQNAMAEFKRLSWASIADQCQRIYQNLQKQEALV